MFCSGSTNDPLDTSTHVFPDMQVNGKIRLTRPFHFAWPHVKTLVHLRQATRISGLKGLTKRSRTDFVTIDCICMLGLKRTNMIMLNT